MVTVSSVDDPRGFMLMAVLQESVRSRGERATAKWLGVDRRTLLACLEQGELTLKVRAALDKQVSREANADVVVIREELEAQGTRIDELAKRIESFGTDFERLETMIKAVRQESAKELRNLGRRVERLERRRSSAIGVPTGPGTSGATGRSPRGEGGGSSNPLAPGQDDLRIEVPEQPTKPWFPPRDHKEIVTVEAANDDSYVYGKAWPLVREWRMLQRDHPLTGNTLSWMERQERLLVVEMALLDEHKLTLPPDTQPIDDFWRTHIMNWRRNDIEDIRRRICRRKLFRWIRRLATFGAWWD